MSFETNTLWEITYLCGMRGRMNAHFYPYYNSNNCKNYVN